MSRFFVSQKTAIRDMGDDNAMPSPHPASQNFALFLTVLGTGAPRHRLDFLLCPTGTRKLCSTRPVRLLHVHKPSCFNLLVTGLLYCPRWMSTQTITARVNQFNELPKLGSGVATTVCVAQVTLHAFVAKRVAKNASTATPAELAKRAP